MLLTIVTGSQVIGALHDQSIMLIAPGTPFQQLQEQRTFKNPRWSDGTATSIDSIIEEHTTTQSPDSTRSTPTISISPEVPYGIFVDEELIEMFEEVCTEYVEIQEKQFEPETIISDLAGFAFDRINPKLTIQTGPVILNDVMKYLWLTPLGVPKICYILAREEFVAGFLSWLQNQVFLSEMEHNSSQNNKDCQRNSLDGALNSFAMKRSRIRMPIGRKCCKCQKRNYMDIPYSVCTLAERTDNEDHTCTKCSETLCQNCDVVFGWL